MQVACPAISDLTFLSSVLGHIDCQAQTLGASGFQALTSPGSVGALLLTFAFTIFVAMIGYRLILGETPTMRDGVIAAIKVGAVLAFATSWPAFRTLAYDVALKGPAQLAGSIGGPSNLPGAGGALIARLQVIDDEIAELNLVGTGKPPNTDPVVSPSVTLTPAQQQQEQRRLQGLAARARWDPARDISLLGSARTLFLTSTIAAFSSVRLIAGLLLALGPLFGIFLLFDGTRGLFEGWVRGLAGAALGALATAIVLGVELALLEPWLASVIELRRQEIATPAVPIELLVLSLVFGLTLLAALIAVARIAAGFHMPVAWRQMPLRMIESMSGSMIGPVGATAGQAAAHDQRERALLIADAVATAQRRESVERQPVPTSFGRPGITPTAASTDIAIVGTVPLGQSFRRRTRGRVSAGATRRDSHR